MKWLWLILLILWFFLIVSCVNSEVKIERTFYDDGKLMQELTMKSGKIDGDVYEYFQSGILKSKTKFVNGVQDGKAEFYFEDGKLKSKAFFKGGLQCDTMRIYYKNGSLQEICLVKDGMKDGFFRTYYDNGKIMIDGTTRLNRKDSVWKYYSVDGIFSYAKIYNSDTIISSYQAGINGLSYQNFMHGFSIESPKNWIIESRSNGVTVMMHDVSDEFRESMSVIVTNLGNARLDTFVKNELQHTALLCSYFEILDRKNHMKYNKNRIEVTYTAKFNETDITVLVFFVEDRGNAITLTCMTHQSEFGEFEKIFRETASKLLTDL